MSNQTLNLKHYDLTLLTSNENFSINGGSWLSTAIKVFELLQIADAINESIDGFTAGFNDAYYSGKSRGHGASGSW